MVEQTSQARLVEAAFALTKPYLDSSVFLAHVKKEKTLCPDGRSRYEITQRIFGDARDGRFKIYTSAITLAEVRRLKQTPAPLTEEERKTVNELFREFMEHEWLYLIEVNREVAEKAQELGALHNVYPMDAIHVASAIWWQCSPLLVWDKQTLVSRIPSPIEGVHICEPYWEGMPKMIEP